MIIKVDEQGCKSWGFKDCRAEPEKTLFDKHTLEMGRAKFERFLEAFGFTQMDRRTKKLGQSVQHVAAWISGRR